MRSLLDRETIDKRSKYEDEVSYSPIQNNAAWLAQSVVKIWKLMRHFLIICLSLLMTGCATKEYLNAQNECSPAAFQQYPVQNTQMYVQRTRSVQVATGAEDCETRTEGNRTYTRCKPEMRMQSVPYQSLEWVDTNTQARNAYLRSCTAQLCVKRFGNQECEAALGSTASAPVTRPVASTVAAPSVKPAKSAVAAPSTKTAPKSPASSEDDDDDDDD
jgi:hypothetical protein